MAAPTITDNLVLNEATIKERLAFVSKKKTALLNVLRQMRSEAEKSNGGEFTTEEKETMTQILTSYEMLSQMEDKYFETINSIVGIRKNATEDFETEQQDLRHTLNESIVFAAQKQGDKPAEEQNEEKKDEEEISDSEDAMELLHKEMNEMVRLSDAVCKGQQINEQLSKRFQLLKEKRRIMAATREQKTAAQVKEELAAAGQYRSTRNRLSNECGQLDRKQKTLDRLRKKVIERGMLAGAQEQQQADEAEEAKIAAETAALETSGLRVPVLVDGEESEIPEGAAAEDEGEEDEKRGKPKSRVQRHKELKEKEAKEKEEAERREAQIRESFARLAARRDRMSAIRSQLETLSTTPLPAEDPPKAPAADIKTKLSELTKMREHLEKLQQSGSDFQDEEDFVQKLASLEASSEEPAEPEADEEDEVSRV